MKKFLNILTFGVIITSIANATNLADQEKEIVLKVGEIEITRYLYEEQKARVTGRGGNKLPTSKNSFDEKKWRAEWINKLLFVCEAKKLGFSNHKEVIYATEVLSDHMLLNSAKGPYAKHLLANSNPSNVTQIKGKARHKAARKLFDEESKEILSNARIALESKTSDLFLSYVSKLSNKNKPLPLPHSNLQQTPIASYYGNEKKQTISVAEFVEKFNRTVIGRKLNSKPNLILEVQRIIIDSERKRRALNLKLDQDWAFNQSKTNFTNNTIYNIYERDLLSPSLKIDDQEVEKFYQAHRDSFSVPQNIDVISVEGDSKSELIQTLQLIRAEMGSSPIDELIESVSQAGFPVEKKTLSVDENTFREMKDFHLFRLKNGQSAPIRDLGNGNFSTNIKLSANGSFSPPLDAILETVKKRYGHERLTKLKAQKLEELKNNFMVVINTEPQGAPPTIRQVNKM